MPMLDSKQIIKNWPIIRAALKMSAMPEADVNDRKIDNIYGSLMSGRASCIMTGNRRKPRTVVVLYISEEEISKTKNLLIYCAHGFERETGAQYLEVINSIKAFALSAECDNIICYVWNQKMKELFQGYGAECNYSLAIFPLTREE